MTTPSVEHAFRDDDLTTAEAARALGFGSSTLERWRRLGIGPRYMRLSRNRVAYRARWLVEWQEQRVVTPVLEQQGS